MLTKLFLTKLSYLQQDRQDTFDDLRRFPAISERVYIVSYEGHTMEAYYYKPRKQRTA